MAGNHGRWLPKKYNFFIKKLIQQNKSIPNDRELNNKQTLFTEFSSEH
jgi:hypothetical protein